MELVSRLISLSAGTNGADEHARVYGLMSDLARELAVDQGYVNLSTQVTGDLDEEETDELGCPSEHTYYDENTLVKVRVIMTEYGLTEESADGLITELQNAGVLFRERPEVL